MIEKEFTCPYCWENQSRLFDSSIQNQNFIEDCEVCCNPIEFNLITNGLDVIEHQFNNEYAFVQSWLTLLQWY